MSIVIMVFSKTRSLPITKINHNLLKHSFVNSLVSSELIIFKHILLAIDIVRWTKCYWSKCTRTFQYPNFHRTPWTNGRFGHLCPIFVVIFVFISLDC